MSFYENPLGARRSTGPKLEVSEFAEYNKKATRAANARTKEEQEAMMSEDLQGIDQQDAPQPENLTPGETESTRAQISRKGRPFAIPIQRVVQARKDLNTTGETRQQDAFKSLASEYSDISDTSSMASPPPPPIQSTDAQRDDPDSLTAKLKILKKVLILLLNYCDKAKNKLDIVNVKDAVAKLTVETERVKNDVQEKKTRMISEFSAENDQRKEKIRESMTQINSIHSERSAMYKDIKAEIAKCKQIIDEVIVGTQIPDSDRLREVIDKIDHDSSNKKQLTEAFNKSGGARKRQTKRKPRKKMY